MAEVKRVEVGFIGSQVISLRLDPEQVAALRRAVDVGEGWHDIRTEDGDIALDLSKVVFVRVAGGSGSVGFAV